MFGFIKRLMGNRQPTLQFNDDPFKRDEVSLKAAVVPSVPSVARESPAVVLQRDEIIDVKTRISGYRFSARFPDPSNQSNAHATLDVLSENRVAAFAERRLALIPIRSQDWLDLDFRPLIGPQTVFVLDSENRGKSSENRFEVVTSIRQSGARVALACVDYTQTREFVGGSADLVLIDFSAYTLPNFERSVKAFKRKQPKLELIADNIGSWAERRYSVSLGVDYCMGPFTTSSDEEQSSGEISESRLVLIEMLNLLRQDAELTEIAGVAKRDPAVAVKLVTMANSPVLALTQSITSIDQACMVLGRAQLYRWLSIAMFRAGATSPRDEVLLELALGRGHFLEHIGRLHHEKIVCDELFLVGLLSLLDSLLGVPMTKVVERLKLSDAILQVLLDSTGPFGRYLMLAIAVERGHAERVGRLAEQLAISLVDIEHASVEALTWAGEAVRLSQ